MNIQKLSDKKIAINDFIKVNFYKNDELYSSEIVKNFTVYKIDDNNEYHSQREFKIVNRLSRKYSVKMRDIYIKKNKVNFEDYIIHEIYVDIITDNKLPKKDFVKIKDISFETSFEINCDSEGIFFIKIPPLFQNIFNTNILKSDKLSDLENLFKSYEKR
jgi:hypothetical protein